MSESQPEKLPEPSFPPPNAEPRPGHQGDPRPAQRSVQRTRREERRRHVASLALAGVSQKEISRRLGVSRGTVCEDLKKVTAAWREEYAGDLADLKAKEAARLDADEARAAAMIHTLPSLPPPPKDAEQLEVWDARQERLVKNYARLMDVVIRLRDRRAKLYGLDAPVKVEAAGEARLRVEFVNDWTASPAVEVVATQAPTNGTETHQ